jgi:hypothetical protein
MRKMVGRLAALAAAGALTFAALPITSASAGTNGQWVEFCAPDEIKWGGITGSNQNGQWTSEVLPLYTELDAPIPANCASSEWWWKGTVVIWFQGPEGWYPDHFCSVPESSPEDGHFRC